MRVRADAFDYIRALPIQPQLTAASTGLPSIRRRASSLYPATQTNLSVEDFTADPFFPAESPNNVVDASPQHSETPVKGAVSTEVHTELGRWITFSSESPPASPPMFSDQAQNLSSTSLPVRSHPPVRRMSSGQTSRVLRKQTSVSSMSQQPKTTRRHSALSIPR